MIEARWSHHALSLRKVNVSPIPEQLLRFLRLSNEVGKRAISLEHHPFCVVMVASDHETVLLTRCNIDTVNHAESTLARVTASNYPPEYL